MVARRVRLRRSPSFDFCPQEATRPESRAAIRGGLREPLGTCAGQSNRIPAGRVAPGPCFVPAHLAVPGPGLAQWNSSGAKLGRCGSVPATILSRLPSWSLRSAPSRWGIASRERATRPQGSGTRRREGLPGHHDSRPGEAEGERGRRLNGLRKGRATHKNDTDSSPELPYLPIRGLAQYRRAFAYDVTPLNEERATWLVRDAASGEVVATVYRRQSGVGIGKDSGGNVAGLPPFYILDGTLSAWKGGVGTVDQRPDVTDATLFETLWDAADAGWKSARPRKALWWKAMSTVVHVLDGGVTLFKIAALAFAIGLAVWSVPDVVSLRAAAAEAAKGWLESKEESPQATPSEGS